MRPARAFSRGVRSVRMTLRSNEPETADIPVEMMEGNRQVTTDRPAETSTRPRQVTADTPAEIENSQKETRM